MILLISYLVLCAVSVILKITYAKDAPLAIRWLMLFDALIVAMFGIGAYYLLPYKLI